MTRPSEAELIEALKPFAEQIELIECTSGAHEMRDSDTWPCDDDQWLKISDLRRAREVYRALTRAKGGKGEDDAHELAEKIVQAQIDGAPEPLRRLGEYLTEVLDEDQWRTAERMLLALTAPSQPASGHAPYTPVTVGASTSQPSTYEGKAEPVAWIADLIRNEYDKAPDLGSASYPAFEREWDDGAESIARKIVARPMHPPAQPAPAVDREAINDLDDVVRELGIESSHVTPAEAVRALYDERDDWSQRYATLAEAATALLATTPDERQSPAVWFPRVDAVKAALLPRAQPSSEEGGKDAELVRELRDVLPLTYEFDAESCGYYDTQTTIVVRRAADRLEALSAGEK